MKPPLALTVDVEPDFWNESASEGVVGGLPPILDLLDELSAKGTFFWTAATALSHSDLLREVASRGHEIACHGLQHENFAALGAQEQRRLLDQALETFASLGERPLGFRAPRLRVNGSLFEALRERGFLYDSSLPFWGLRRFKYGRRYDDSGIRELKCVPSYAFRLSPRLFARVLARSAAALGQAVLFLHPWEIVEPPPLRHWPSPWKRIDPINRFNTGPPFLERLSSYLRECRADWEFRTCLEIAGAKQSGAVKGPQG